MRKLLQIGLFVSLFALLLPGALGDEWNGYPNGYVLCETLSLRETPDNTAPVLYALTYGQKTTIIETKDNWCQVIASVWDPQTGMVTDRRQGWVRAEYLLEDPTFFTPDVETPVYALPAPDAKRVALLDAGSGPYAVIAAYEGYLAVSLRGASGFIVQGE